MKLLLYSNHCVHKWQLQDNGEYGNSKATVTVAQVEKSQLKFANISIS